jgi:hypothetical protein
MSRACLLLLVVATLACAPRLPLAVAPVSGQDVSQWPPADQALLKSITAMGNLQTLREQFSTRTTRDGQPYLSVNVERAYVAPDRRYEKVDGRSVAETVAGEVVYVGSRFFRRTGDGPWQELGGMESFVWPAREYTFASVRNVAYEGPGDADGRPARIVRFTHEGSVEMKNAGWQFETRLWLDPDTGLFLRRETRGVREDIDLENRRTVVMRHEGTWTYLSHNANIAVNEPPIAE